MGRFYIRARLVNAWRRLFPHPAVVAMRERRRVARNAANRSSGDRRAAVRAMAERLREERPVNG
jgi:hypothetical protein